MDFRKGAHQRPRLGPCCIGSCNVEKQFKFYQMSCINIAEWVLGICDLIKHQLLSRLYNAFNWVSKATWTPQSRYWKKRGNCQSTEGLRPACCWELVPGRALWAFLTVPGEHITHIGVLKIQGHLRGWPRCGCTNETPSDPQLKPQERHCSRSPIGDPMVDCTLCIGGRSQVQQLPYKCSRYQL